MRLAEAPAASAGKTEDYSVILSRGLKKFCYF